MHLIACADVLSRAFVSVWLFRAGGLDEAVDDSVLTAAFRPFGDLQSVLLPKDASTRQHTTNAHGDARFRCSADCSSASSARSPAPLYYGESRLCAFVVSKLGKIHFVPCSSFGRHHRDCDAAIAQICWLSSRGPVSVTDRCLCSLRL